jgi:quinoprotein glucose dehydrogenase
MAIGYHANPMAWVTFIRNLRVRAIQVAALVLYLAVVVGAASAAQAPAISARTVWDGVFTIPQADRGRTLYAADCAECHGSELQGAQGTALIGEKFWGDWSEQSVNDLLTYVSKNMPFSEDGSLAGSLPAGTYADIVAHILRTNGFPAGAEELTAASTAGVQIVRKDGPGELPASTLVHVVGCLAPRAADGSWRLVKASRPVRVSSSGAAPDRSVPLGDREFALKFVLRNLTTVVGHRMSVTGLLLGAGGADGLNVSTTDSLAATCE